MTNLDSAIDTIKQTVSAIDAARALGIKVDRTGKCCCIFHADKHPSMKLYDGNRGFYCFVCHKGGSVIDIVQQANGCTFRTAMEWLDSAFHLGLCVDRPMDKNAKFAAEIARERRRMERAWQEALDRAEFDLYTAACKLVNDLEADIQRYRPTRPNEWWHTRFCKALKLLPEARETADRLALEVIGKRGDD